MTIRYFHLYADNKTIKELSIEEYRKRTLAERFKLVVVTPSYIGIVDKGIFVFIDKRQLDEILKQTEEEHEK